jgi:putative sterol carrier protein
MNLVVQDVPFPPQTLNAHLDTTAGFVDVELGHLDSPDVTVNLDYQTARAILVDGNAEAGMQAFMAGKVRVEGDMTKLLAFQAAPPSPSEADVSAQIREITAT